MLECPVQIVELQLTEFHVLAIGVQESFEHIQLSMAGKTQVLDAALVLLRHQVAVDAVFFIVQIGVDVHLAHVVEEVEVEVVHTQLFQLAGEDLPDLAPVGSVVAGELCGNIEPVSRIKGQRFAHHGFRVLAVIAPGGVIIVDAALHGCVHHTQGGSFVDPAVISIEHRQAHRAKAQRGKLQSLKIPVNHVSVLLLVLSLF